MRTALHWLCGMLLLATLTEPSLAHAATAGRKFALLVGCTRYDNLTARRQLRGPANDVVLLRRLLIEQFEFDPDTITVLAESDHIRKALRDQQVTAEIDCELPTDANITREFERLIREAQPEDTIFILLAGHGSQQPDRDADLQRDPEPDGLDELFLPCNIGRWKGGAGAVEHALSDDQLRTWIGALVERGVFVFFVADTCHSGTVTRGLEDDGGENYVRRTREVDASELGVPDEQLPSARASAGSALQESDWLDAASRAGGSSGLVALYAVQSHQEAIEERPDPSSPHFGRLCHTLAEVLSQAGQKLTYHELAQRILWRFEQRNWISATTPGIEGTAIDRVVFGLDEWPGRSQMTLHRGADGMSVTSGALHGLTLGSILAVYPPVESPAAAQLVGYVRVTDLFPLSARVEPIAWGDAPLVADLPDEGRCELAYRDVGSQQLRLALQVDGPEGAAAEQMLGAVRAQLEVAAENEGAMFRLVETEAPDWVAVIVDSGVYLQRAGVPKFSWDDAEALQAARRRGDVFGAPYPIDAVLAESLTHDLDRIARADALRRLAEVSGHTQDVSVDVRVEALLDGRPFRAEDPGAAAVLKDQVLRLNITNTGLEPVAVVVFYIDSANAISLRFPRNRADERINQIPVGGVLPRQVGFQIDDSTVGWEHVVVIAVGAKDQAAIAELVRLEQESLIGARGRGAEFTSPLARLVDGALTGTRAARDPDAVPPAGSYAIRRVSWNVVAQ